MSPENKPGGRLMPLHIYYVGPHYVIYEVALGGLTYMGSFIEAEFLEWLRTSVEDRSRRRQEIQAKKNPSSALNIKLEL